MQVLMSWDAYSCMDSLSGCAIPKEDVEEALQGKEGRIDELKKNHLQSLNLSFLMRSFS